MNENQNRFFQGNGVGYNSSPAYPGRPSFGPGGAPYESQLPAVIPQQAPVPVPTQSGGAGLGGLLGNLNLGNFSIKDVKGVIDRMGGVEGIVSTMGKLQKLMSSVQQMQPMIKLLLGSFSKAGKTSSDDNYVPRRRRRRKKRRSSSRPLNQAGSKRRPRR